MLHILLLILKIIGIIILCILGLALLLLGIVLFVPIRYKLEGSYQKEFIAKGRVSWLLHLITVQADYNSSVNLREVLYKIKIFGITVKSNLPKKEKKRTVKKKEAVQKPGNNNRKTGKAENKNQEALQMDAKSRRNQEAGDKPSVSREKEAQPQAKEGPPVPSAEKPPQVSGNTAQEGGSKAKKENKIYALWKKLTNFLKNLWEKIRNIPYTIKKMCDRINQLQETIEYYRDLWESEDTKRTVALCKKQLLYLGRKLKPRRFRMNLLVGMEDPYYTGQILAYYGMLYPWIGGSVNITGDFENPVFQGDFSIKGKIRIFTLVKVGIIVYFNKNIRTLLKQIKKEEI